MDEERDRELDAELVTAAAFEAKEAALRAVSWTLFGVAVVISVLATAGMAQSRAGFMKMFVDMNIALPTVTLWATSPWCLAVLPGLALAGLVKELLIRRAGLRVTLSACHLLLVFMVREWYAHAMFQPLVYLMRNMGN